MSRGFVFVVTPHCTAHTMWFYIYLTIQLLWEEVKHDTVMFLPVLVIFDILRKILLNQDNNIHNLISYVVGKYIML